MRLLIAIPVFNERKYVEHVLAKVLRHHSEILLIDDGSTDGTADLLAQRRDIQLIRAFQKLDDEAQREVEEFLEFKQAQRVARDKEQPDPDQ